MAMQLVHDRSTFLTSVTTVQSGGSPINPTQLFDWQQVLLSILTADNASASLEDALEQEIDHR